MTIRNFIIFPFLLTAVCTISAQDFAKEGVWEIGGRIYYTSETSVNNGESADNSTNTFSLQVPVYYFVMDGLEVGLIPGYDNQSRGDNSISFFRFLAGIAYNIDTRSNAYPFIEGQIGYNTASFSTANNSSSISGIIWSLHGGVKVQVGGNALVGIGLFYEQRTLESSDNQGGRDGYDTWGIDAGFAVFFGR